MELLGIEDARDPARDSTKDFSIESDRKRAELLASVYERASFSQLTSILEEMWKRDLTAEDLERLLVTMPQVPIPQSDTVHGHAILEKARQYAADANRGMPPCGTILENGCGLGHFLDGFAANFERVIAVDFALAYLVIAKKMAEECGHKNVEFICANVERLPIASNSVDFIHSNNVIEHVTHKPPMFAEAYRVLKPGGLMFVLSPNHFTAWPEPHFGLPFYGFIPKPLRRYHAKRSGRDVENVTLVSLGQLKRLTAAFGSVPISFIPRKMRATVMGGGLRSFIVKALNSPLGGLVHLTLNRLFLPIMPYHVALCFKDSQSS